MPVSGGHRARAFFARARRAQPVRIRVGFLDQFSAMLASQLEYGNRAQNLPERPAFRRAIRRIRKELPAFIAARVDVLNPIISEGAAREIATWAVEVLQDEYHAFSNPREGPRQRARKGFSNPLVGEEGPRLINRIAAEINGQKVD